MSKHGIIIPRRLVKSSVEDLLLMMYLENQPYWIAGSYRRLKAICSDVDIILIIDSHDQIQPIFDGMMKIFGKQETNDKPKTIGIHGQIQFDVHMIPRIKLGAMLFHTTGSWEFNRRMRIRAMKFGWKLNQYGIYDREHGNTILESEHECDFFNKLNLDYVEPKER